MMKLRLQALAIVVLISGSWHLAHADGLEQTHQTMPSANFSFIPDLQNFLRVEDANRFADLHSSVVVSGGLHSTTAGLVGSPSALLAYLNGIYTTESGTITYPDSSTCHVIAHADTTANQGSYTRVSGTHYLINCASTLPPALPANAAFLMTVTTSGGAITAVADLRPLGPISGFDACRYATLADALAAYGSGPGTFTIGCPLLATADATLPANTTAYFTRAGYLYCNTNGVTITAAGYIDAPLRRIFALTNGCLVSPVASATPMLYPQWWGILGDASTDNSAELGRLLTTLPGDAVVYFPCGDYRTSAAITIPAVSRLRITGAGSCAVLRNTTANVGIFSVTAGADQLEIDHLRLVNSGALATLGRGLIYLNPAGAATPIRNASFHHLWLAAGSTSGISGNCLVGSTITSNFFYNDGNAYGEHGLYLSNAGCVSTDNTITTNYFWNTTAGNSAGISMRQLTQSIISANTIVGWKYNLLPLSDAAGPTADVRMTNNILVGAGVDGVNYFADSGTNPILRTTLSGNTITGAGRNGLRIEVGAAQCSIIDNDIVLNGETGIYLYATTSSTFTANRIQDNDADSNGAGGSDSSGFYLAENNVGNTFTSNTANTSTGGSYQRYGVSIGSSGNTGNYFLSNIWADNRTAERDVGATTNYWFQVDTNGFWSTGHVDNALIGIPADEGTCTFSAATSKVCSLAYTQPDTNYRVVMTCNANKTFWVNTKTTTTFTANASSSSSDNCDWVLMRY